jgi:hypothetical protein
LETTIFSFVFADDSPEKTWATIRLFEEIQTGRYVPYASDYVIDELSQASEPLRSDLLNLIDRYGIITLEAQEEATKLAQIYLREKIVPPSHPVDALHLAIAAIMEMDFIVSWNFRHIVKRNTILATGAINLREGYKPLGIFSPMEVIDYADN